VTRLLDRRGKLEGGIFYLGKKGGGNVVLVGGTLQMSIHQLYRRNKKKYQELRKGGVTVTLGWVFLSQRVLEVTCFGGFSSGGVSGKSYQKSRCRVDTDGDVQTLGRGGVQPEPKRWRVIYCEDTFFQEFGLTALEPSKKKYEKREIREGTIKGRKKEEKDFNDRK